MGSRVLVLTEILSSVQEPYRIEGKKTMGLELAEQFGFDVLPDVILYPTGEGDDTRSVTRHQVLT